MGHVNYIYIVFKPDGIPAYVGKGSGARYKRHDSRAKNNRHYENIYKKYGQRLQVLVVARRLSESAAYAIERFLTNRIGIECEGGPLVNCGHGGYGGPSGIRRGDDWCKVRSQRAQQLWQNPEYRRKMLCPDRARSGNKTERTQTFKDQMSQRLMGNTHTLGMRHTDDAKAKMSAAQKGKKKSASHRAKIAESNRQAWIRRKEMENFNRTVIQGMG